MICLLRIDGIKSNNTSTCSISINLIQQAGCVAFTCIWFSFPHFWNDMSKLVFCNTFVERSMLNRIRASNCSFFSDSFLLKVILLHLIQKYTFEALEILINDFKEMVRRKYLHIPCSSTYLYGWTSFLGVLSDAQIFQASEVPWMLVRISLRPRFKESSRDKWHCSSSRLWWN